MAIKLLIGGSPCTHWSIAQKNNRETEPRGEGWELFKNYLIAKEKFKPDFFLYENNKSAAQAIKDQIAEEFGVGVDPDVRLTYINSALVSAQNRQRFYVTNFGNIEQPEDRGMLLEDILETGDTDREKGRAVIGSAGRTTTTREYFDKQQGNMSFEPVRIPEYGNPDKSRPVRASYAYKGSGEGSLVSEAFPENPNKQVSDYVAEPVRVGALPRPNGELSTSQVKRVYSIDGKSVNLVANGGGEGAKTGLYAIQVDEPNEYCGILGYATPIEWDENGIPTKAVSCADGKVYTVYEVKDRQITIRGKQYPIKLVDGYYIIRKLTVRECARLQTMPDDYCKAVSDSQAYKALGNGWTAEVIIHLLNHALKDVPRDEEIIVLSMYDGIATGRYCLDKMGFTNVTYHAYEIDKYPIMVAMDNYPDIIQHGDAFAVREDDWKPPQSRSEWLDELLGGAE
jgi:DNA (cytosine-5)-methyltransferase 3A